MTHRPITIKLVSHFFQFPDEALLDSLEQLAGIIAALPQGKAREVLAGFAAYLQSVSQVRLQEEYSRQFDFNPATSLNLTYHRHGDGRERGTALVELLRVYQQAGFLPTTRELPDYLPLVLEFLAICHPKERSRVVEEYQDQIETLANRLIQAGSPYGQLLSVVADNLRSTDFSREG